MKNFIEGRNRQYKAYVVLSDEDKKQWTGRELTHIKISLEYAEGEPNYFSGGYNKRGYRISVTPISRSNDGPFASESYSIMGDRRNCGGYTMIEEAKRYNARILARLALEYDMKVPEIAKAVIADDVTALIALVRKEEAVTV